MRRAVVMMALAFAVTVPQRATAQAVRPAPDDARAVAQSRVQQRVARLLRERVGLSDEQMRRLAPVNQRFDARRQQLFREERDVRQALRRDLSAPSADEARVSAAIERLFALQRRRLDLAAEEQRELAAFMTPVQRARYLALQEHLRRRVEDVRRRRGGGRRGGPGGVGPRL